MNHRIIYGGLTFACIASMAGLTYRRIGYNNWYDFMNGILHESNSIPMSILGALQVKCFDALLTKYIEN